MTDSFQRYPAPEQALHAGPRHVADLATTTKRALPVPFYLLAKGPQCGPVARHPVVADVAIYDCTQPLPLFLQRLCMRRRSSILIALSFACTGTQSPE